MSTEPDDEILQEMAVKIDEKKNVFKLEGYISSCEYGCGRSSTDRQFCYINSRPCDVTKVSLVTCSLMLTFVDMRLLIHMILILLYLIVRYFNNVIVRGFYY